MHAYHLLAECPVLSGALAKQFVQGLQGDDPNYVAATAGCKHFVVHGGPDNLRQTFSANVSLRDWATTFLPQFESCVQSGGLGMMCSFNSIRGVPACANHRAMQTWAKGQWNFSGYIVSDQGAAMGILTDHKYATTLAEAAAFAVNGGLDLEDANSPSETVFGGIADAIKLGLLSESQVDESVSRLMYVRMRTGEFDDPGLQPYRKIPKDQIRSKAHLALTRQVATQSLVLLQNRNRTLPLTPGHLTKIAVVGPFADCQSCYYGKYSPHMDANLTVTVAGALHDAGNDVMAASGCSDGTLQDETGWSAKLWHRRQLQQGCGCVSCPCPSGAGRTPYECKSYDKSKVTSAIKNAELCIIAVGLGANVESEGRDRQSLGLALPGKQNALVADAIAASKAKNIPVIALLFVAGPVDPLLFAQADAVIDCLYPAESAGLAIADILYGKVSPAGRLPFSWPTKPDDVPPEENYTMVGRTYRYAQKNVKWAFGFGLSYASFHYEDARLSHTSITANSCTTVNITVTVANAGSVVADEVVQSYLRWSSVVPEVETPLLSLVDFERVSVPAGGSAVVSLSMTPRDFAVLTSPRCGVVWPSTNTALVGTPLHIVNSTDADSCCAFCAQSERCEAFTFHSSSDPTHAAAGTCELHTAWGLTNHSRRATSGEPLSQWVLRPGTIEVLMGGSSDDLRPVGTLTVTGTETPLTKCPTPAPNERQAYR
eukprot:COSAG02_NODE_1005_length_15270_cov_11.414607_7_plen_714_part_00